MCECVCTCVYEIKRGHGPSGVCVCAIGGINVSPSVDFAAWMRSGDGMAPEVCVCTCV